MFSQRTTFEHNNDASLVMLSLGGNRDAFCQIVKRYQTLLCSIAYSALGDIKHSEDVAQDTFVEAWKKLDTLHNPEKLKSWLCGIVRFKISRFRRQQPAKEQLVEDTEALSDIATSPTELETQVISAQHHALMWQALHAMDETYREPLVLFYREQQSVETVAAELDLSTDTVKQRLSRGRNLLKQAMSDVVEEALQHSKPGAAFTVSVMTLISGISPPAKAALVGTGSAKLGSVFSFTTLLTFLAVFSGFISSFLGVRAGLDQSRTRNERRLVFKSVALFFCVTAVYVGGMFGLKYLALHNLAFSRLITGVVQILVLSFTAANLWLVSYMFQAMRTLRAHERIFHPEAFTHESDTPGSARREYKSRLRLFGVPLMHFQFGMPEHSDRAAYGWFAGGSHAYGLLFAWGGVAIAPVSVGIVAIGGFTVGAVGIGVISTGTVAIGLLAFGASAIGYKAYASLSATGWESAFSNGVSLARDAAIGPVAQAAYINNEQAASLTNLADFGQVYYWLLAAIALLVIVPAIWHAAQVRTRMKFHR
ncbi:sigma-70 family RNA polymerase sigma factor [Aestuariibacter sp. GS-14]|uniref:RNA polymerase sigma factor n=1 Tax=Aestuariibacter sp. GS-14 TaxID=2590670 RepID=UPI00112D3508|nr:sigma-70 family RNA polymerase sigma factor [Aestuariibacter sp. GS-14]TPV53689.1 sigma-70 family RNA polymerase sigma factor [Aestuariibacter sp. GS-14]